jgi:hypothetical protein
MDLFGVPVTDVRPLLSDERQDLLRLLRSLAPHEWALPLDNIAAELNARPRKRHAFQTPAEVLEKLLSEPTNTHGVA